ncbi:hypothetical protein PV416_05205 [Streptomyces ipomoeae]|uniref:hypothetical protein n=1 Tax=Streptomyces ipomoeae TaxID=103232 RepID=UPI0029A16BDA|nr:hypothetical protein [Streptomyces ipomoeae]MDX2820498.1 hypothetical protein [Streptomyces ipomoeae]MDX2875625.1 hypothetical protein [Streptomyces ipomoeae]
MAVTYLMLARLPEGRLGAFDAYESAVLPLLAEHGGVSNGGCALLTIVSKPTS